ncbi:MAG: hypothetical protein O7C58_05890 [Rickettsia endosymbiont of Ixodes persulcatus]|nr:hypothetical protein [Rickettsia endosymbiont of Ixodes persulcatus]
MKIQSKEELFQAKKVAMKIVKQRSTASGAVAAVPVPGVDVASDIGLCLK